MFRTAAFLLAACALFLPLSAQNSPVPNLPSHSALPDDPSALLGYGLAQALAERGPPSAVSVFRGPEPWQDDVVFQYEGGYSFFWFENHLWQIRFVAGYPGSVLGLFVGDGADKVVSLMGQPYHSGADSLQFRLPWKGYPVQLRVMLREDRVSEMYIFRADF